LTYFLGLYAIAFNFPKKQRLHQTHLNLDRRKLNLNLLIKERQQFSVQKEEGVWKISDREITKKS
jgi:hypothetical protein